MRIPASAVTRRTEQSRALAAVVLRRELETKVPEAAEDREVPRRARAASFLCLGALSERKNVRLADAFRPAGDATFVGDGPLRRLAGRPAV